MHLVCVHTEYVYLNQCLSTVMFQEKNVFEHTYFGFMWQMCGYLPTTLPRTDPSEVSKLAAQLGASFVLETMIHAREKPTMGQWIEMVTKQFNSCHAACEVSTQLTCIVQGGFPFAMQHVS